MKHLNVLSMFLFISMAQANVIRVLPDEDSCSIENGINSLSKGIMAVSELGNLNLQLEGVNDLLNSISIVAAAKMNGNDISYDEKCELCNDINRVNEVLTGCIEKSLKRSAKEGVSRNAETEKKTILEGLKQIVSGVVSMIMGNGLVKPLLTNVLTGVMKIVGAIFADGQIDNQDWANVKDAVASLLTGKAGKKSVSAIEEEETVFF